jgi:hypothetical protein
VFSTTSTSTAYRRHGPGDVDQSFHTALRRTFRVGDDYWVTLGLAPALHANGDPIWSIHWQPEQPKRLTSELIRQFDASKAQAMREIAAIKAAIDRGD